MAELGIAGLAEVGDAGVPVVLHEAQEKSLDMLAMGSSGFFLRASRA